MTSVPTPTPQPSSGPGPTSTATSAPPPPHDLAQLIDGDLSTSWQSKPGIVANQRITIELNAGKLWNISSVLIDPAATNGGSSANDLNRFAIFVSRTGLAPADFHRVLQRKCKANNRLQKFALPKHTVARYVQLLAKSNHGGNRVAIAEFEVYGRASTTAFSDTLATIFPERTEASSRTPRKASPLAIVRAIIRGLTERPPHQNQRTGHVKDPLQSQYGLQTLRLQKAGVAFRDGTTLQIAPQSSLLLRDAHITTVNSGKVEELVAPGTDHRVQTAAAVASAVGTRFLVIVKGKLTTVAVIEGAVRVRTKHHSVLVKTGQETTVRPGHRPSTPRPDPNLKQQVGFAGSLPAPPLPVNIALDYNGGRIISGPPS